jgi:VanZ family protein
MVTRPPERRFFVLFTGFWLPVLAYVTTIFALSSQPHLAPPLRFLNADKVLHAGEYLLLGLLLVRALRATLRVSRPLFAAVIAIGLAVLVGTADEFLQSFIPGRESDVLDLLADTLGGAIAQLIYVMFVRS